MLLHKNCNLPINYISLVTIVVENGNTIVFFFSLSFIPNCGDYRTKNTMPVNTFTPNNCVGFDGRTIYKESYLTNICPSRALPIMPRSQIALPQSHPVDPNTIYKVTH